MTIHLPENVESSIREAVDSGQFASLDDAMTEAARLLLERLQQRPTRPASGTGAVPAASPARKRIWEVAEDIRKSIPAEEWDKLPVDGAAQHDHYIYGLPKRPTA